MIKKFFMFSTVLSGYESISVDDISIESAWLYLLFLSFKGYNPVTCVEEDEKDSNILLIYLYFVGDTEEEQSENKQNALRLSRKNYDYVMQKWHQSIKEKPKYFILQRSDDGWIDIETMNQLSETYRLFVDTNKIKILELKRLIHILNSFQE